ncbi:hypothetical protein [Erwinia sp.]|uniref:hypothetical protein n=1 Tax=Erwinia citreus TaxID=558 RepID=UPI003C72D61D
MSSEKISTSLASCIFLLSIFLLTSVLSVIKQISMHYGLNISDHSVVPYAFALSLLIYIYLCGGINKYIAFPIAFLIIAIYQSSIFPDQSWDGLAYHQKAAWYLMHGGNLLYDFTGQAGNFWISPYPKSTWYFSGELGILTGNLSVGSSYQLVIGGAMFFYIIHFFKMYGYNVKASYIFAALCLLNHIFIAQSFSYYVDATMGFLAILMIFAAVSYGNRYSKIDAVVVVICSIIVVNIKFSWFLYVGAVFLVMGLRALPNVKKTSSVVLWFALFLAVGVGFIGSNPYIKNISEGRHVFYPLFGKDKKDIITFASPESFQGMNRGEKLFISTFSKSENINEASGLSPTLKIPGHYNKKEFNNLAYEDLRIGGFGVYFSLALVISIIILISRKMIDKNVILILSLIVICTILNPESWWARYAPHLYLIPLLPLMMFKKDESTGKWVWPVGVLVAILIVNITIMSKARYETSKSFNDGLEWILGSCKGGRLNVTPVGSFLIDPMLERGSASYVISDKQGEGSRDFRRKFSYSCSR